MFHLTDYSELIKDKLSNGICVYVHLEGLNCVH